MGPSTAVQDAQAIRTTGVVVTSTRIIPTSRTFGPAYAVVPITGLVTGLVTSPRQPVFHNALTTTVAVLSFSADTIVLVTDRLVAFERIGLALAEIGRLPVTRPIPATPIAPLVVAKLVAIPSVRLAGQVDSGLEKALRPIGADTPIGHQIGAVQVGLQAKDVAFHPTYTTVAVNAATFRPDILTTGRPTIGTISSTTKSVLQVTLDPTSVGVLVTASVATKGVRPVVVPTGLAIHQVDAVLPRVTGQTLLVVVGIALHVVLTRIELTPNLKLGPFGPLSAPLQVDATPARLPAGATTVPTDVRRVPVSTTETTSVVTTAPELVTLGLAVLGTPLVTT